MPISSAWKRVEPETPWFIAAAVFFVIGTVAALGEWVFHWWEDPGQYLALGSYALTIYAFLTGTSRRFVRGENARLHQRFDRLESGQRDLVQGQRDLVQGQRDLVQGQREQTSLLQRLVDSFRGR